MYNNNNNKYNSHRLPLITPEMLRHQPDQACEILNKLSGGGGGEATVINEGTGNLEDIEQTTTSYDDGGVNIVTAYLSGGATSEFQIRNGRKGSQGDPGPAGQDGADGADGFSPIATVTKSGDTATITITDQGGTTTATVSDGTQGEQGNPGPANTLSIGTVQQGVTADATITGTSPNQTLNLTLPKGDQGPAGPANSLSIGTVQQGITADATITGTPPNQVLNLSLPKGDPGAAGPANTLTIGTVVSGATADATITGTSPNQTLNLTLPKGDAGSPGPKGDPGAGCPIGTILPYSGSTIPANYLECRGQAISRATYADLFSVIGTSYGAGDGTTTFNLPNLKGMVPVGQDTNDTDFDVLGETGGSKTINLSHSHTVNSHNHSLPANTGSHTLTTTEMPFHSHNVATDGNASYTWGIGNNGTTYSGIQRVFDTVRNDQSAKFQVRAAGTGGNGGHTHTIGGNTGDASPGTDSQLSSSQSILQPYLTVKYIIKFADDAAVVANVVNSYSSSSSDVYSTDYINNLSISATVVVTYNSGAGTWSSSKEIIDAIESGDSLVWQHNTSPATEVYTVLSAEVLSSTTASLAVKICDTTNDTTHVESYVLSGADTTSGTYAIDIGEEPVFVDSVLSSGGSSLIQTTDIADGSITFPKLSFDGVQINSVLSSGGTSQIQTTDIADGAITSDKIDSTTLYASSTGTQTDFSLSDSPANYDHVEVYFSKQNFATCKQCTIFSGDSTKWFLSIVNPGTGTDSTFYINSAVLDISGTNVAYTAGREGYFNSNAQSVGSDTKPLKIFKVIGYK